MTGGTTELALLGGAPAVDRPLVPFRSMGEAEKAAVLAVVDSDCLSGFYGSPGPEFLGGPVVRRFEEAWRGRFGSRFAVSVNSATSGLIAAMAAIGISPGDEVIVPPTTMSATAMAPLFYGGIPVFADIEDATFCLDPSAVREALTPRTRAILAVNLFGHPARLAELRRIADASGIFLIEDNAQAPLGAEHGRACGTIGHIGIFSLNYHKHIHTGEGGMCLTDDARLAERLQLVRNHAENNVEASNITDPTNLIGMNLRMTELSAAIGIEQLKRIDARVAERERIAAALTEACRDLDGLTPPLVRAACRHNYYVWALKLDEERLGLDRDLFSRALAAEGFPHSVGYIRPLYMLPVFQKRVALGRDGFPFDLTNRSYHKGLCPVAERLHEREFVLFEPCAYAVDPPLLAQFATALRKVHAGRRGLADWARRQLPAA